uniref:Uncharacterized protein n=1 Tax=Setaria digitata TaxID=48799 RepID=A0A915PN22_9BILA
MADNNKMQVLPSSNEETVEAGDQTLARKPTKSIRGKSEIVRITDETFDDDHREVDEVETNKISDDMIKKLLICNKNDATEIKDNPPKTPEQLEEEELLQEIAKRPLESFKNMKDIPDAIAKVYYKDITRRWKESEARIKETESLLSSVKYEDRSLEEDRLEILGELLDKATQSFEIYEEHENRKVPYGHRLVLETRLLIVFNNAVNLIYKIIGEFDKLKGDQVGVNDERDQLRYEIRYCDAVYTEVHERFLKSYLEMEW